MGYFCSIALNLKTKENRVKLTSPFQEGFSRQC